MSGSCREALSEVREWLGEASRMTGSGRDVLPYVR